MGFVDSSGEGIPQTLRLRTKLAQMQDAAANHEPDPDLFLHPQGRQTAQTKNRFASTSCTRAK
jgi:hypothetical protein